MDEIGQLIKEWETLRQESHSSINNRTQIMSFGLAVIGIIAAGIFSSNLIKEHKDLFLLAFTFGIPAISITVFYIWLGEAERMFRAGAYLTKLEKTIHTKLGEASDAFRFEEWVQSSKEMLYPYIAVFVLFFGLAFASSYFGTSATGKKHLCNLAYLLEILMICPAWYRLRRIGFYIKEAGGHWPALLELITNPLEFFKKIC